VFCFGGRTSNGHRELLAVIKTGILRTRISLVAAVVVQVSNRADAAVAAGAAGSGRKEGESRGCRRFRQLQCRRFRRIRGRCLAPVGGFCSGRHRTTQARNASVVACARVRAVPAPPPIPLPIVVRTKNDVALVREVVRSKVDRVDGAALVVVVVVIVIVVIVIVIVGVGADDIIGVEVNTHAIAINIEIGTKISYMPAGVCVSLAGDSRRILAHSLVPVTSVVPPASLAVASLAVAIAVVAPAVSFVMLVLQWSSAIRWDRTRYSRTIITARVHHAYRIVSYRIVSTVRLLIA